MVVGLVTIGLIVTFGNPCRNPRPGADLTACDLTGQDLSGKDLTGATLTGAVLRSAGLSGAVLSGADLTEADLTGADLSNANLESATLTDATLAEADLGHAVLTDATLGGADLTRANLVGATLSGASLNAATLENADVSESEMVGTDLTEANLSEADLSGSAMTGASLARSSLDGADLTGADLENADLSSSSLTGAVLHRSNLTETVGLTDEMLADALGVAVVDLAAEVYRLQLHFDDATAVIAAVAPAVAGTGVQGAHPYVDSAAFHPLVVVGAGGEPLTPDWAAGVQGLWMPEALRFVELVAVTEAGREEVEDCGMYVNSVTYAETGHLIRYRETIGVRVYAAATGQLVAAQVFRGPDPRACNPENEATSTILNGLWGEPADYAAVVPWLAGIIHAPTNAAGT